MNKKHHHKPKKNRFFDEHEENDRETRASYRELKRRVFPKNGAVETRVLSDEPTSTPKSEKLIGTISLSRQGYGFVTLDESEADAVDLFIPAQFTDTALTGDRVEVIITDKDNPRGPSGKVVNIVKRHRVKFTGQVVEYSKFGKNFVIKPLSSSFNKTLTAVSKIEVRIGDWVEFSIRRTVPGAKRFDVQITKKISVSDNEVEGILSGIVEEFDLPAAYTEDEEKLAGNLELREISRRDMTEFLTMTIDPKDAKDFDDALSVVSETEKEIEIAIHIADVAAYVAPGCYFDKKASERNFTNYLPGRMIPMLPKTLLKERCSLNADELKPAHTVLGKLNKNSGEVKSYERFHSWVKVAKRLNYAEVQQFLDANDLSYHDKAVDPDRFHTDLSVKDETAAVWQEWTPEIQVSLRQLFATYKTLRNKRRAFDHYVEVMPKEICILCHGNPPEIAGIKHEVADESHEIVEEFMLLANTLVAEETLEYNIPAVYRVHPAPLPEGLETFSKWLKEVLDMNPGSLKTRKNINKLLKLIPEDNPYFEVVMISFIKAMERALYSEKCTLHYGLGKEKYLHFTSPIRRYSDLFVHQQLWEREINSGEVKNEKHAAVVAKNLTATEKRYDEAYWSTNDRLKLHFIENKINNGERVELDAVIMNFTKAEITMFIPEIASFGAIPYDDFNDYFEVNENVLESRDSDLSFKRGQIIKVLVTYVSPLFGEVKYAVVNHKIHQE